MAICELRRFCFPTVTPRTQLYLPASMMSSIRQIRSHLPLIWSLLFAAVRSSLVGGARIWLTAKAFEEGCINVMICVLFLT